MDAESRARAVRLLVLDVDGVLTDGGLYYDHAGQVSKRFDVQDGLGIRLAQQAGIEVAVITGLDSEAVSSRIRRLGIIHYHAGIKNKFTVSSNLILDEILGIKDLRTDKRIDFVGGIRGLGELKRRVDSGEMRVAFALYPVSMQQLIDIADTNNIMPPKTTWFEPKLRSGLVIHKLV